MLAWFDWVFWVESFLNDNSPQIHFCFMEKLKHCFLKVHRWIAAKSTYLLTSTATEGHADWHIRKKKKVERVKEKQDSVWQFSPVHFESRGQNYTSVLLCWSVFQILRHVATKRQRSLPDVTLFSVILLWIFLLQAISHNLKRKEAFKKHGYANWGHRHLSGKKGD